jgi:beta-glucosidase
MIKASLFCAYLLGIVIGTRASDLIYKDKSQPIEQRINDLLQRMTLEEKILQMNQWTYGQNLNPNNIEEKMTAVKPEIGSLLYRSMSPVYRNQIQRKAMNETRLGIPIIFGFDAIHGYRTIFPIPLAQSCSWNTDLVKESCVITAKESWLSGLNWTFSPMVDVARDPRWGRVAESYGEDPYANAIFGVAAVKGYQGENLADKYKMAACLKHYVGYSLSQGGRDYQYSDVSAQTLWETCLVPFEAGVKAGAATLMSGFNDISGIPATSNHYTLTEILKNQWHHDGFVVSDWESVKNLVPQGVATDAKEACFKSVMAGLEMDMVSNIYKDNLAQLVAENKVPMATIDEAVRRILRIKFRLGLFDNPYVDELAESERYLKPEYIALASQLTAESMVLLKNENQILPLNSAIKNIALIGPLANDSVNLLGSWSAYGESKETETFLEGINHEFGSKAAVHFSRGCSISGADSIGFNGAREAANKSDIIIVCLGEDKRWSGENGSRSSIALPQMQEKLVEELYKTKKPIILVLSSGRPIELMRLNKWCNAIIEAWQPGMFGGSALAGIISGRINPSGKLSITFPQTTGQIPMYYNTRQSSRPLYGYYQDIPKEPMFPFGHGLSYTKYEYSNIKLSAKQITKNDTLIAEIEVSNTGKFDGNETMLWYISDPVASISRPSKELKFFEKKVIKIGQKKIYQFIIDPRRDLSFVDNLGNKHLEVGEFFLEAANQRIKFELVE